MPSVYIRNVPSPVYRRLKERAKHNRRSITREAAMILEEAVGSEDRPLEVWETIDRIRERLRVRYGSFPDSVTLIREDRGR